MAPSWPTGRSRQPTSSRPRRSWATGSSEHLGAPPLAVGHRVVHGGPDFAAPVLVDDDVLARLERLVPLAPLHQPNNLAPIRSIRARRPDLPQVACFDTAFHRGHPEVADRFAIPQSLYEEGVRRYGFHGLSYEHIASRLPEVAPEIAQGRVVVAHLGSGVSACALVGGRSVDSTMGFTALDGLPMGTRPGQLDPGVVLYLAAQKGMEPRAIEHLLYHDCGLKGLSGISNDVRDLLASDDPRARLALDYFTYRIAGAFGALAAAMEGIDGIVLTAGVGEHGAPVRAADLPPLRLARRRARPCPQRGARPPHHHRCQPHPRPRHPDRRGADDRAPHPGTPQEQAMIPRPNLSLEGRKGLVTGIANESSIAWGCAKAFRSLGADLAVTYLNDKARPHVEPLAQALEAPILMPLDLRAEGQLEAVFERITAEWGRLDFLLHSIAFAPMADLHGRVVDCSKEGFLAAMEVSCWSFLRMAKLAEPLMKEGGTLFCMTYYGSQMVVEHYGIMGPVKAALESATRYLAAELGPAGIRVHAISPGPLKTRAASGIAHFDEMLARAQEKAPARSLVSTDDVGLATAYLATDAGKLITGETLYIDGGYHIID